MPRLGVADLRPGHVTAAPVTSLSGVVLIQGNTELTPALIALLGDAGVGSVAVTAPALSPEARAERRRAIEARFAGHDEDAWMRRLRDIVLRVQAGEDTDGPDA